MVNRATVVHAFNPALMEVEAGNLCEVEASMVYKVHSRTVSKATEKPWLKKPKSK